VSRSGNPQKRCDCSPRNFKNKPNVVNQMFTSSNPIFSSTIGFAKNERDSIIKRISQCNNESTTKICSKKERFFPYKCMIDKQRRRRKFTNFPWSFPIRRIAYSM
jgi:hypothetical protein